MIFASAFDWSVLVTTPFLPCFLAGVVFLILGIVGGGFSYKSLSIPRIDTFPRTFSGVVGTLALTFGLYLVLHQTQQGGIESLDCAKTTKSDASDDMDQPTMVQFVNRSSQTLEGYWLGYSGETKKFFKVLPGQVYKQQTYVGHIWLLKDESGKCIAAFRPSLATATIK